MTFIVFLTIHFLIVDYPCNWGWHISHSYRGSTARNTNSWCGSGPNSPSSYPAPGDRRGQKQKALQLPAKLYILLPWNTTYVMIGKVGMGVNGLCLLFWESASQGSLLLQQYNVRVASVSARTFSGCFKTFSGLQEVKCEPPNTIYMPHYY